MTWRFKTHIWGKGGGPFSLLLLHYCHQAPERKPSPFLCALDVTKPTRTFRNEHSGAEIMFKQGFSLFPSLCPINHSDYKFHIAHFLISTLMLVFSPSNHFKVKYSPLTEAVISL